MEMYNPMPPGEVLVELYLKPSKTSARKFASQLGVSPSTITRILNGQSRITPAMAERISKLVNLSPASLLTLQEMQDRWQERLRNAA